MIGYLIAEISNAHNGYHFTGDGEIDLSNEEATADVYATAPANEVRHNQTTTQWTP